MLFTGFVAGLGDVCVRSIPEPQNPSLGVGNDSSLARCSDVNCGLQQGRTRADSRGQKNQFEKHARSVSDGLALRNNTVRVQTESQSTDEYDLGLARLPGWPRSRHRHH